MNTENDTFNALKRQPASEVWYLVEDYMHELIRSHRLEIITTSHPEVISYMNKFGWDNGGELYRAYQKFIKEESKKYKFD